MSDSEEEEEDEGGGGEDELEGKKTHLCAPFYTENDHFTKTGSGQT
eukprot:COSAG06_NODE_48352_length_332_cov_1.463519_1_plen_46_part_00